MSEEKTAEVNGVIGPWLICSMLGYALAVMIDLVGVTKGLEMSLLTRLENFSGQSLMSLAKTWHLLIIPMVVLALAWALLDSPGMFRRVGVLVTSFILLLLAVPILAFSGVFFSPVLVGVAVLWTGACALFYGANHSLPCDGAEDC